MIDIVQKWVDERAEDVVKNYNDFGLKASGEFEKSVETKVTQTSKGINAKIRGNDYGYFLENGRKPTSEAKRGRLYGVILKWVEQKGIQVENKKSFAYLVARKIDREGVKVPNQNNPGGFVSKAITPESINDLSKQLVFYEVSKVRSDIIKLWQ